MGDTLSCESNFNLFKRFMKAEYNYEKENLSYTGQRSAGDFKNI